MPDSLLPEVKSLMMTPEPADLGPGPRAGVRPEIELEKSLAQILDESKLTSERIDLVRSLILLWHDHLDAAHLIAQTIENSDGSFVHAIMHRREPAYSNAKHWFHRVGAHPAFPAIAAGVASCLEAKGQSGRRDKLTPRGVWDPFAFVDACESAVRRPKERRSREDYEKFIPAEKRQQEPLASAIRTWLSAPDSENELLREIQRIEMEVLLSHLLKT
jgi:hypothetical protein